MKPDEFQGQGGSYIIKDGKRIRVEEPTRPSDTGGARDADGKPLPGTVPPAPEPETKAATEQTIARPARKTAAE